MANEENIKNFTAADIERYHKGLLSSKERHAMEKAALDDPFLADALEGYSVAGVNAKADIHELRERLQKKTEGAKVIAIRPAAKSSFPWLRAAVAIVLIAGAGLLVYQLAFNNKKIEELAVTGKKETETPVKPDSSQISQPGSTNTATETTTIVTSGNQTDKITNGPPDKDLVGTTTQPIKTEYLNLLTTDSGTRTIVKNDINAPATMRTNDDIKKSIADSLGYRKDRDEDIANREKTKTTEGFTAIQPGNQNGDVNRNLSRANPNRRNEDQYKSNIFRGRVTDADNRGLPFAKVTNMDDNVGTYADANGNFNLISPDTVLNVQVRSIGFNNNNYELRNAVPNNRVVMQEDKSLNEVVISNKKPNAESRSRNANMKLEEPEPADGWDNYDTYIANNLDIPDEYKEKPSTEAVVEISFEVDKNGEPVNIRVEKSLCAKCDEEAKRLIKQGPKWRRHAKKGRTTVKVPFSNTFQ